MGKHNRLTKNNLDRRAREWGGRCLSEVVDHSGPRPPSQCSYEWECHCGDTWQARYGNTANLFGCPSCSSRKAAQNRSGKTFERALKVVAEIGGSSLHPENPVRAKDMAKWRCALGHIFEARPDNVCNGHFCPQCGTGTGENLAVATAIIALGGSVPEFNTKPDWLRKSATGYAVELDAYWPELKVALDYRGAYHYRNIPVHGGAERLEEVQKNDAWRESCMKKKGEDLIIVSEFRDLNDIDECISCVMAAIEKAGVKIANQPSRQEVLEQALKTNSLEKLRISAESLGLILISDVYLLRYSKYFFHCMQCGNKTEMRLDSRKVSPGCKACVSTTKGRKAKLKYENEISPRVECVGWTLLGRTDSGELLLSCPDSAHAVYSVPSSRMAHHFPKDGSGSKARGCPGCVSTVKSLAFRMDFEQVREAFKFIEKETGWRLADTPETYIGAERLKVICPQGHLNEDKPLRRVPGTPCPAADGTRGCGLTRCESNGRTHANKKKRLIWFNIEPLIKGMCAKLGYRLLTGEQKEYDGEGKLCIQTAVNRRPSKIKLSKLLSKLPGSDQSYYLEKLKEVGYKPRRK